MEDKRTFAAVSGILLILILGYKPIQKPNQNTMEKPVSFLALGDSYTIGESVVEAERWPVQLADSLNASGVSIEPPEIIAKTGWTTDELMQGIEDRNLRDTFDLVSLLIGVNNQYRGWDTSEFRSQFNTLLDIAIGFAGGHSDRVFVVSIPDWGVTHFAEGRDHEKIAKEIDVFNQIKKEETEKRSILFFDITGISRVAASDPTLTADDGLHPSGKMYALWVEKIAPQIRELIK
jgi:lysophospholipase L1-like esterase